MLRAPCSVKVSKVLLAGTSSHATKYHDAGSCLSFWSLALPPCFRLRHYKTLPGPCLAYQNATLPYSLSAPYSVHRHNPSGSKAAFSLLSLTSPSRVLTPSALDYSWCGREDVDINRLPSRHQRLAIQTSPQHTTKSRIKQILIYNTRDTSHPFTMYFSQIISVMSVATAVYAAPAKRCKPNPPTSIAYALPTTGCESFSRISWPGTSNSHYVQQPNYRHPPQTLPFNISPSGTAFRTIHVPVPTLPQSMWARSLSSTT